MKYFAFLLFTLLYTCFPAHSSPSSLYSIQELQEKTCFPVHIMETEDCIISFIEDNNSNKFIVKQIKDPSSSEQFLLVLDAFACSIANKHDIPMNQVSLIPPNKNFPGKYKPNHPASLHTIAPGKAVEEKKPWPSFNVHQKFRRENSWMWNKWGPLPEEETGLTPDIIHHMSLHPTLPKIVALDTFVGNADRSNPNIFYEHTSNTFFGIDMAASFNTPLPKQACTQLKKLFNHTVTSMGNSELTALKSYRDTLESLIKNCTVEKLHNSLDEFARLAGFEEGSTLMDEDVRNRIFHHKKVIKENYTASCRLLEILKTID